MVTRADFETVQLQITDFIASVECTPHPAQLVLCDVKDRSHLRLLLAGLAAGLRRHAAQMRVIIAKRKTELFPMRGIFREAWLCRNLRLPPGFVSQDAADSRCRLHGPRRSQQKTEVLSMLGWVVTFLVIALIAGILGFGGVAGASIEIAKIIFFIAIVLFLVSAIVGVARGRRI
jgi:uncharacterized membrane protein YtjA (UPF0391 family)